MNKITSKTIAMIIIELIIILPLYSSLAFAGFNDIHIYGRAGFHNYLDGPQDTLTIEAEADLYGVPVNNVNNVYYNVANINNKASGERFNSCINGTCIFQKSGLSQYNNPKQIYVYLFNDTDKLVDITSDTLYFDITNPQIVSFGVSPSLISNGTVQMSFEIFETSDPQNSNMLNKCSGIKEAIVTSSSGNYSKQFIINSNIDQCTYSTSFSENIDNIAKADGDYTLTLTVYDNVNRTAQKQASLKRTTVGPIIETDSFSMQANGQEIEWINSPIIASASITVKSDNLNVNSVIGDFSGFKPGQGNLTAACTIVEQDSYSCLWDNISIEMNKTASVTVNIAAEDNLGNKAFVNPSKTIKFDNTGPEITSITTPIKDSLGNYYLGIYNSQITVDFNEEGIGVSEENMLLDLSQLGLDVSIKADSCENSSCTWNITTDSATDGIKTVFVHPRSGDNLGNNITGELNKNIIVDKTPPYVTNHDVNYSSNYDFITTGDSISIIVTVGDTNYLDASRIYADLTAIVTDANHTIPNGGCEDNGDRTWSCVWDQTIDVEGHVNSDLKFYFYDVVGNSIEYSFSINVIGFEDQESPDLWSSSASCSPNMLDRQTLSLIQQRSYCQVSLSAKTSDQQILSLDMGDCAGELLSSSELMNANALSTTPYIKLVFEEENTELDAVNINCTLSLITRAGGLIYSAAETENVNMQIGLYNTPLGEISNEVYDKIKKVHDDGLVSQEWIGSLREILGYAEKICSLWGTLNQIVGIIDNIAVIIWGVPGGQALGVETAGKAEAVHDFSQKMGESWFAKVCEFVNCDRGLWGDWYKDQQTFNSANEEQGWASGFFANDDPKSSINQKGIAWPHNTKDSIVLSAATGCIPGIIYNVDKWRQIECNYGLCLINHAHENINLKVCEDQKSYLECKALWGEVFQVIPFSAFFKDMLNHITTIFSDPLSLVFGFTDWFCAPKMVNPPAHKVCTALTTLPEIARVFESVSTLGEQWSVKYNVCKDFEKAFEDIGVQQETEETEETTDEDLDDSDRRPTSDSDDSDTSLDED